MLGKPKETRGISPKGAKIFTDNPNENGLFDSVDGFIQGNADTALDAVKKFNNSYQDELYRRGELRDLSMSKGLSRLLRDRDNYNLDRSNNKNFNAGRTAGRFTDLPLLAAGGALEKGLSSARFLDEVGAIGPKGEKVYFHASPTPLSEVKDPYFDVGMHAGSMNQALDRVTTTKGKIPETAEMYAFTIPEERNGLMRLEDSINWNPSATLKDMYNRGYISYDDVIEAESKINSVGGQHAPEAYDVVRNLVDKKRRVGGIYKNGYEGDFIDDSIFVSDPRRDFRQIPLNDITLESNDINPQRWEGADLYTPQELLEKYLRQIRQP